MAFRRTSSLVVLLSLGTACGSGDDSSVAPPAAGADASVDASTDAPTDGSGDGTVESSVPPDGGEGGGGEGGALTLQTGSLLPTGWSITPIAARGSTFDVLSPQFAVLADHATSTVVSPDGKTLLILTSGYNKQVLTSGADAGATNPNGTGEWIFVYDISANKPSPVAVLEIPNSYAGIAFNPSGTEFYVAGGQDDLVHVFDLSGGVWAETSPVIGLGHIAAPPLNLGGLGLQTPPQSAGLAVDTSGRTLVVANYENDSISIVDLTTRAVTAELDLRPGKAASSPQPGVAGGEFPFWVAIKGTQTAYVTSQRDREVDVVDLTTPATPAVAARIPVGGQPSKIILNRDQTFLFVANGSSDTVSVIDTSSNKVVETIDVSAPSSVLDNPSGLRGVNPNSLALSPDEKTLYVTNGGANAVAVVTRDPQQASPSKLAGLIPTGWYPASVSVSADGTFLYVVNGKSVPGAACLDIVEKNPDGGPPAYPVGALAMGCNLGNQYVLQLQHAGFLSLPVPSSDDLAMLTQQVARNNLWTAAAPAGGETEDAASASDSTIAFLHDHIKHVIYIIKENRTYDQVLGDVSPGNGDSALTMFPQPITPNFHQLASQFVTLDAFFDTGEVSGVGWNWSTAARTTDSVERNQPINYGKGGLTYDFEGTNRNVNVGLATPAERLAALPLPMAFAGLLQDPDLLPGAIDV
ncbi:MAG: beta-propeller fold lactonase family protein, partial [Polyangiaceae bacterium]|nr:beta-propeller fold lactonase family protein [Polyangiaceae bacterium]